MILQLQKELPVMFLKVQKWEDMSLMILILELRVEKGKTLVQTTILLMERRRRLHILCKLFMFDVVMLMTLAVSVFGLCFWWRLFCRRSGQMLKVLMNLMCQDHVHLVIGLHQ